MALGVDLFVTFGLLSIGPGVPRPRMSDPDEGGKGPDAGGGSETEMYTKGRKDGLPTPVCDLHHLDFMFLLELMQPKVHLANRQGRFAPSDFNKSDQRRGLANVSIRMVEVHEVDSRTSLGILLFSPPSQLATSVCYWSAG